jgi:hypothetical protein
MGKCTVQVGVTGAHGHSGFLSRGLAAQPGPAAFCSSCRPERVVTVQGAASAHGVASSLALHHHVQGS